MVYNSTCSYRAKLHQYSGNYDSSKNVIHHKINIESLVHYIALCVMNKQEKIINTVFN